MSSHAEYEYLNCCFIHSYTGEKCNRPSYKPFMIGTARIFSDPVARCYNHMRVYLNEFCDEYGETELKKLNEVIRKARKQLIAAPRIAIDARNSQFLKNNMNNITDNHLEKIIGKHVDNIDNCTITVKRHYGATLVPTSSCFRLEGANKDRIKYNNIAPIARTKYDDDDDDDDGDVSMTTTTTPEEIEEARRRFETL